MNKKNLLRLTLSILINLLVFQVYGYALLETGEPSLTIHRYETAIPVTSLNCIKCLITKYLNAFGVEDMEVKKVKTSWPTWWYERTNIYNKKLQRFKFIVTYESEEKFYGYIYASIHKDDNNIDYRCRATENYSTNKRFAPDGPNYQFKLFNTETNELELEIIKLNFQPSA